MVSELGLAVFRAAISRAIEKDWVDLHESGTSPTPVRSYSPMCRNHTSNGGLKLGSVERQLKDRTFLGQHHPPRTAHRWTRVQRWARLQQLQGTTAAMVLAALLVQKKTALSGGD
jgi:hypothetical protein